MNTRGAVRAKEQDAVFKIETCWCSYRDRQMFKLLKYAVCAAEHSLTHEILRKVSPAEAELLRDPVFQPKVRFRFAGTEFPPYIVFKIYIQNKGKGVKYISGKKIIKPASEAAADACQQMGNRKFLDQMITDLCQHRQDKITDEMDVTNLQEYMKYLKHMDELPAPMGGKDNTWRNLSLAVLPRQHIMYDIVSYLQTGEATNRLKEEMPSLVSKPYVSRPGTQATQVDIIQCMSNQRRVKSPSSGEPSSSRRSKQARQRVAKMRKMYGMENSENQKRQDPKPPYTAQNFDDDFDQDDWDKEGKLLYEWTQELSVDNISSSPR